MADFSAEGLVRVDYVVTIASIASPDASSELNAPTTLHNWLVPDGWAPTVSQNAVETTSLASTFITSVPGTEGGPFTLTLKRDNVPANDTAWNLFKAGPSGYLVVREGIAVGTAYAAGDKVQVYPGKAGAVQPSQTATNTVRTFQVTWFPSSAPNRDATVQA